MERRTFLHQTARVSALAAAAGGILRSGEGLADPRDQVIAITGAGSGFGQRMALTFARAGYRTYATLRETEGRNRDKAENLRRVASNEGLNLTVLELDVTRTSQGRAVVNEIIRLEGRLDVWVNNAGILVYAPTEVVPRAVWELQMTTNVFAPMELAGLVLPQMRKQGSGLIINVSSRVGRVVIPGIGLYCTSKFALEAATEAAHYEATPQGIDFALIQPSAFGTDINRNARRIYQDITLPLFNRERPAGADHHRGFLNQLNNNFAGNPTRDPQEVADLALRVVQRPRADRVLRYPIGDEGELKAVRETNGFLANVQSSALWRDGYGDWYRK